MICVSIVSHGHGEMVTELVRHVLHLQLVKQVIITYNIRELATPLTNDKMVVIHNSKPKGFGSNHNSAFSHCHQPYFCILNPDISFDSDPFGELIDTAESCSAALAAPIIISPNGEPEDSFRNFPTFKSLFLKFIVNYEGRFQYLECGKYVYPDWIAGMFMFFRSNEFMQIRGFDQKYYLYYEDVDICARLHLSGKRVVVNTTIEITHNARRMSHKNWKHLRWHLNSMARYLLHYGLKNIR